MTDIEIKNQALVMLGEMPINAPGEGTNAERISSALWESAVKSVLRAHPWNFAMRREILSPLTTAPKHGYTAAFQLPAEVLRLVEVSEDDYVLEGRQVLCNASVLNIRAVYHVTDVSQYDSLCCDALAANLAWKMAYPITRSTSMTDYCGKVYAQVLQQARTVDAQEEPSQQFHEAALLTVRS